MCKGAFLTLDRAEYGRGLYAAGGGVMTGVGSTAYLACDNAYIGALLFAVGLFTICACQLGFYTGKVGYLVLNKGRFYTEVLQALAGNAIGTALARTDLYLKPAGICIKKLEETPLQTLFLSFFAVC